MLDRWISAAIGICGSQKKLAELMGIKPEKVSFLLNRARKISLEDALLLEEATKGGVTRYHVLDHLNERTKKKLLARLTEQAALKISERVAIGIACENKLGDRKGQRSDLKLSENFPKVKGRTKEIAANQAGFGNYRTYQQAKQVVLLGSFELIKALDDQQISISLANKLAVLPENQQKQILRDCAGPKEIIDAIKQTASKRKDTIIVKSGKLDLKTIFFGSLKICFYLLPYIQKEQ